MTIDRDDALRSVKHNRFSLENLGEELQNDFEIVIAAVQRNGAALQYASDALRKDKCIVLKAVRRNGMALEFASKGLCDDKKSGHESCDPQWRSTTVCF